MIDDMVTVGWIKNHLAKPSWFQAKYESLIGTDCEDPSSLRKKLYSRTDIEIKAIYNGIEKQPENERNALGKTFYRAYSKLKAK